MTLTPTLFPAPWALGDPTPNPKRCVLQHKASPCLWPTCSWPQLYSAEALNPLVAGEVAKGTIGGSDTDVAAVPGVLAEISIALLV